MKLHVMDNKELLRTELLGVILKELPNPHSREEVAMALIENIKKATLCLELSEAERDQLSAKPPKDGYFPTHIPMNGKYYYILFKKKD